MPRSLRFAPYRGPAGGWGSVRSLATHSVREGNTVSVGLTMLRQNKPDGFACASCAWAKPADRHPFEFCENGAKATIWELTPKRVTPAFFNRHTVSELLGWSDHALEEAGRLTEPLRYDPATDRYVRVAWEEAFAGIGRELRAMHPDQAVFYSSGRAALETSYMYQLLARMYGTNNLPDSSNMCHESTSVALPESIGVPVGTVTLEDFAATDAIFFFGQNVGSNSPRMLHDLQACARRGVPIVVFNPLRERGFERFANPQSPGQMLADSSTPLATLYLQPRIGGDLAAILGICKAVLADGAALDRGFIAEYCHGFEEFAARAAAVDWPELEHESGLSRGAMEAAAAIYGRARAVMGIFGMGLTQHRTGVENVQMLMNLLLLGGHIGRPGAGILPVRGHSNVQGQRTVGISENPELVPLDRLAEMFGFAPPRGKGLNTVEACEKVISGEVRGFLMLGGNFVRAVPDRDRMEPAWRRLRLTVNIATKLNRSHLLPGAVAYLLPCLGRTERDMQQAGVQSVSVEDSTACIHGSRGLRQPASPDLLSEPAIVAGIACATLAEKSRLDWRAPDWSAWVADYRLVRDAIAQTWPEQFHDMDRRMWQPGGFHRPIPARARKFHTSTGRANFITPHALIEDFDTSESARDVLRLMTLRSNDQFNTTIYGMDDRFRGVHGTRNVILMHRNDMTRLGLRERDKVALTTAVGDDAVRRLGGLAVLPYDIPEGCIAGYYPECNVLLPIWHRADRSFVPAAKSIPVRLSRES